MAALNTASLDTCLGLMWPSQRIVAGTKAPSRYPVCSKIAPEYTTEAEDVLWDFWPMHIGLKSYRGLPSSPPGTAQRSSGDAVPSGGDSKRKAGDSMLKAA